MTRLACLALVLLLAPTSASAQSTAFAAPVSYQSCTQSWAFACGRRDAEGRTYGTAHPVTHCSRYTFAPDGSLLSEAGLGFRERGRYRIEGDVVHLELLDERGEVRHRESLALADDGRSLGAFQRVEP